MHKKSMKKLLSENRNKKSDASSGNGSMSHDRSKVEDKIPSKINEPKEEQSSDSDKNWKYNGTTRPKTLAGVATMIANVISAEHRILHNHHSSDSAHEEETEEVEEEEEEESNGSLTDLGIGSRVYKSIVAAFENNRDKKKDISAALIVALIKYKGNQRKRKDYSQFLYHHVELSEKPDTPEPPSTPLWKTYRWKAWAIKKGIIPPEVSDATSSEMTNIPASSSELEVSSYTGEETSGERETPESNTGSGEEEIEHSSENLFSNSSKSIEDMFSPENRVGTNESEGSDETKVTNSEEDQEEEEEEEGDEDIDDETDKVECVHSEMYEALKKSFEANIGKDATAALIVAVKQPKNQNKSKKAFSYLCHPVELKEIVTEKPSTPLWKTFRWKAWAVKKGLLESSQETSNQASGISKEIEVSSDSREGGNETDSARTLNSKEESGEEESAREEEDEEEFYESVQSPGNVSAPSNDDKGSEQSQSGNALNQLLDSERTGDRDTELALAMDLPEYEGESAVDVTSLRSTQGVTEIQSRRNRLSLQRETEAEMRDRLMLKTIIEKLKKTDLKSYCQRYMLAQEEKRMKEEELQKDPELFCASVDSIYTKCSSSSDNIADAPDLKTNELPNKTKLSLESTKSLTVIREENESSDADIPTNLIDKDTTEGDGEETDINQEIDSKISIAVSKIIDSLEQMSIDNLRKTSLEMENSAFTDRKHSTRDSLPPQTTLINQEKSFENNETEIRGKSIISSDRKKSSFSDKIPLENRRVSTKTPPVDLLLSFPESENMVERTSPKQSDPDKPLLEGHANVMPKKPKIFKKKVSLVEPEEYVEGRENRKSTLINDDVIVIKDVEKSSSTISNPNKNLADDQIMANDTEIECNEESFTDFQFSLSNFSKMAIKKNLANCKISIEKDYDKVTERKPIARKASVHAIPERAKQYRLVASVSQIAINQSSIDLCDSKDAFDSPTRLLNFGSKASSRALLVGRSSSDIARKIFSTKETNKPIPLDGSSITGLVKGTINPIYCLSDISSTSTTCSQLSSETLLKQQEIMKEASEENEIDEKLFVKSGDNLGNVTHNSNTSPSPRSELGEKSLSGNFVEIDSNYE